MKNERKSHSRGLLVRIGCIAALFLASEISSHPPIPFAIPFMVARWLKPNFFIVGVWPFGHEGLWLRYATLQNLLPSFPWIAPGWRAGGRDQILPSGNTDDKDVEAVSLNAEIGHDSLV